MNNSKSNVSKFIHESDMYDQLMYESLKFANMYGHNSETNHNDSVDAFRHAYSHAFISYKYNSFSSKLIGDSYELLEQNPTPEKIMDFYNNQVGREIGEELSKNIKNLKFNNEDEIKMYIALKVDNALKSNKLILTEDDKRIKTVLKQLPDHPLKIYTREDIDMMSKEDFKKAEKNIFKQIKEFSTIPTKKWLKKWSKPEI